MSRRYELVKKYYDTGLWDKKWIRDAVIKSWITSSEYQEITGENLEQENMINQLMQDHLPLSE